MHRPCAYSALTLRLLCTDPAPTRRRLVFPRRMCVMIPAALGPARVGVCGVRLKACMTPGGTSPGVEWALTTKGMAHDGYGWKR